MDANEVFVIRDAPSAGGEIQGVALLRGERRNIQHNVSELHGLYATRPRYAQALSNCLVESLATDEQPLSPLHGRMAVIPASEGSSASGSSAWWDARRDFWQAQWLNRPTSAVHKGSVSQAVQQRLGSLRTEYVFGETCGWYRGNLAHLDVLGYGARVVALDVSSSRPGKALLSRSFRTGTLAERLVPLEEARSAGYLTVADFELDETGTCALDQVYIANSNDFLAYDENGNPYNPFHKKLSELGNTEKCTALADIASIEAIKNTPGKPAISDFQVALFENGAVRVTDPLVEDPPPPGVVDEDFQATLDEMQQLIDEWRAALQSPTAPICN